MKRFVLPGLACALSVACAGCGPMQTPMPQRLDAETQKKVDEGWDRAFTPAGRYPHQDLLDVMVGAQAYQLGIDSFQLRSEKRFAGGKVVMEVRFDRAKPDEDLFEVTVLDAGGKRVRQERYSPKEIDETYGALFANVPPPKDPNVPDRPEIAARRAGYEARWNRIYELFPQEKMAQEPQPREKP